MCAQFLSLFDASDITNYLNDLFAGVLSEYIYFYRNLACLSNVGPEALVGSTRSVAERRCNSGHTGVNGKGSMISCYENWTLRKFIRLLDFLGYTNRVNPEIHHLENAFVAARVKEYNEAQKPYQARIRADRKANRMADGSAAEEQEEPEQVSSASILGGGGGLSFPDNDEERIIETERLKTNMENAAIMRKRHRERKQAAKKREATEEETKLHRERIKEAKQVAEEQEAKRVAAESFVTIVINTEA